MEATDRKTLLPILILIDYYVWSKRVLPSGLAMHRLYQQIARKIQETYRAYPRTWLKRLRVLLVFGILIPMALFSFAVASQSYRQQLEAAIQQRDWDQANTLIEQMIQDQPQNREALEAYQSQILQLQEQDQGSQPASEPLLQPAVHDLPGGLRRYRYDDSLGDYLSSIDTLLPASNYLRWNKFPVSVYVQSDNEAWSDLVEVAIDLWKPYIPLIRIGTPNSADITIERMPNQDLVAGIAQSRDLFLDTDGTLQHRVSITIGEFPRGGPLQVSAVATHELGHALGLWGHSEQPADIMYFALNSLRSEITDRDLNTLKRVYEQPTLIGTRVPEELLGS